MSSVVTSTTSSARASAIASALNSAAGSRAPSRAPSPPPARRARRARGVGARRNTRYDVDRGAFLNKGKNGEANVANPRSIIRYLNRRANGKTIYRFDEDSKRFLVKNTGTSNVKEHKARRTYKGVPTPRRWDRRFPNEYAAIQALLQ